MSRSASPSPRLIRWAVVLGLPLVLVSPVIADSLLLSDGTRLEGKIDRADDGWLVTLASGKQVHVHREQVVGFNVGSKNDAAAAVRRLASLRSAAENMPDLKQIVERFRDFAQQNAGTPVGDQAAADLVVWEDRLERKLIKLGDKWITDTERAELLQKSFQTAEQAMDPVRQNRIQQATPIVDQAVTENPQNPAAWYLRGLLFWKQDKAPEARKAFEQVVALSADSAPAHNNLAVVLWRQKQHVAALLAYDKALLAAPQSRLILDNIAEALYALEPELRGGANVKKVVRHFNDQDVLLQQALAQQGWMRWGSTWVQRADYQKLKAQEKVVQDQLDRMEADYNALTTKIKRMDGDIAAIESEVRRMEADSVGVDARGNLVRYPLPPSYYSYLRDLGAMKTDREQRVNDQQNMRKQARQLVASMPTPKYTGVQRMVDVEGTPVIGRPPAPPPVAAPAVPIPGAPVVPAPAAPAAPPAPAPGVNVTPTVPAAPTPATPVPPEPAPAATAPPIAPSAADLPALPDPHRKVVPPEKPSILDRRLSEPPPGDADQPLLDPNARQ